MATRKTTGAAKKTATTAAKTATTAAKTVTTAAKAAEEKVTATVKETVKKAPARRATKKAAAKVESKVFVQFEGNQVDISDIAAKAAKAYQEDHKDVVIKSLEVYVKPEENVAYYVVNGEGSEDFKVALA